MKKSKTLVTVICIISCASVALAQEQEVDTPSLLSPGETIRINISGIANYTVVETQRGTEINRYSIQNYSIESAPFSASDSSKSPQIVTTQRALPEASSASSIPHCAVTVYVHLGTLNLGFSHAVEMPVTLNFKLGTKELQAIAGDGSKLRLSQPQGEDSSAELDCKLVDRSGSHQWSANDLRHGLGGLPDAIELEMPPVHAK